jgi:hypothetical protein
MEHPLNAIAALRQQVYDYFHGNAGVQQYFFDPAHEDEYVAYYNSMYLLQDSTESLIQHRERGFSADPLAAYLEFWGVMQAAIIQQDAIAELHRAIFGHSLDAKARIGSPGCRSGTFEMSAPVTPRRNRFPNPNP